MRVSNTGAEQRAKVLARQQSRDISEKVAFGLAKPTISPSIPSSSQPSAILLGMTKVTDWYDQPLFHGSTAAAAIYKAKGNIAPEGSNDKAFGGGPRKGPPPPPSKLTSRARRHERTRGEGGASPELASKVRTNKRGRRGR